MHRQSVRFSEEWESHGNSDPNNPKQADSCLDVDFLEKEPTEISKQALKDNIFNANSHKKPNQS